MSDDLSRSSDNLTNFDTVQEPAQGQMSGSEQDLSTQWAPNADGSQRTQNQTQNMHPGVLHETAVTSSSSPVLAGSNSATNSLSVTDSPITWYEAARAPSFTAAPGGNQPQPTVTSAASTPVVPSPSPTLQVPYYTNSALMSASGQAEPINGAADLNYISHTVRSPSVRVSHLDSILKALNLSRSGVKKVKQERLLFLAQQHLNARNFDNLHHMREVVQAYSPWGNGSPPTAAPPRSMQPMTYTQAVNSITRHSPPITAASAPNPLVSPKKNSMAHTPLSFMESPFYKLEMPLATPMFFIRPYTRRRVQQTSRFRINPSMFLDSTHRVYLISQQFFPQDPDGRPVYFPFYIDITVDDQEVKANTRGVRGSVGSAKPVDLTNYLKTKSSAAKSVTVTIHVSDQNQYETVSDKSFAMGVYLAQKVPLPKLVSQINERPHITVERTKEQIRDAAADEEGLMSTVMRFSLRDAVMRTRIKQPMRSRLCQHIDCFDAESYFMLQDQAETWKCPICNKRIVFDSLHIDDYFKEILDNTSEDIDVVEVAPDGTWSVPDQENEGDSGDSSDSDDNIPANKRARSEPNIEVVDLLSDTDEEVPEPVQPVPPRSSFQSRQTPGSPKQDSQVHGSVNQDQVQESSDRTTLHIGSPNQGAPVTNTQPDDSSAPMTPLPSADASEQGATNEAAESAESISPAVRPPSPAPPPHPPEPRLQIAQMLQSFRGSNSVLFHKSLPYPPGYNLLWSGRNDNNGRSKTDSGESETFPASTPHADSLSPSGSTPGDLSDDNVIDLTGDD